MPTGRPSNIDKIIRQRELADGTIIDVTVFDQIVDALAAGNYVEAAAAFAGQNKDTVYDWLKIGARICLAGRADATDLTAHERRCVAFSDAVAQAEAEWEVNANTTLERLGRGGITTTTVTTKKDGQGNVIETIERVETLAPNAQVLQWRLTRRHPERYSQRIDLGLLPGELTVEERAAALATSLESYLAEYDAAEAATRKRPERTRAKRGNGQG